MKLHVCLITSRAVQLASENKEAVVEKVVSNATIIQKIRNERGKGNHG